MVRFHGDPPTHLTLDALDAAGVRHAFTTRHHPPPDPRAPFAGPAGPALHALGVAGDAVRFLRQAHGTTCLLADDAPPGLVGTGDALATTCEHPLAVFSADCLAVVLVDPVQRVLAVAHAGWRGTVGGFLGRLVAFLVARLGVQPARLRVGIGPSIGPCCYEVDAPVVGPLQQAFPETWARWVHPRGRGRWGLDLWRANTDQLADAGVPPAAIANPRLCTACHPDLFFSYRRERSGRSLVALARLAPAAADGAGAA